MNGLSGGTGGSAGGVEFCAERLASALDKSDEVRRLSDFDTFSRSERENALSSFMYLYMLDVGTPDRADRSVFFRDSRSIISWITPTIS